MSLFGLMIERNQLTQIPLSGESGEETERASHLSVINHAETSARGMRGDDNGRQNCRAAQKKMK